MHPVSVNNCPSPGHGVLCNLIGDLNLKVPSYCLTYQVQEILTSKSALLLVIVLCDHKNTHGGLLVILQSIS